MTIDTNVLVAYLDDNTPVVETLSLWKRERRPLFLPSVVEVELLSFAGWEPAQLRTVEIFLEDSFFLIPLDRTIARIAARIRQQHRIKTPDAVIAATALFTHTPLVTKNTKDFKRIAELQIIEI